MLMMHNVGAVGEQARPHALDKCANAHLPGAKRKRYLNVGGFTITHYSRTYRR